VVHQAGGEIWYQKRGLTDFYRPCRNVNMQCVLTCNETFVLTIEYNLL
jgi:hypothetical protein